MSSPDEENIIDPIPADDTDSRKPTRQFLTKVRIANFKRIEHAELELGPVTYIGLFRVECGWRRLGLLR